MVSPADRALLVLVVDADPASREAVAKTFESGHAAVEIAVALDARAAAQRLRDGSFDVVLADIGSLEAFPRDVDPGSPSGTEGPRKRNATRQGTGAFPRFGEKRKCSNGAGSREAAVSRLVRAAGAALVVALSDGASVSGAVAAMGAGAHDCIAKPVDPPVLWARLAELARRHGRPWAIAGEPAQLPSEMPPPAPAPGLSPQPASGPVLPLWRQEQRIIEEALAHFSGNIVRAAAALQISPSTIYRKRRGWDDAGSAGSGF